MFTDMDKLVDTALQERGFTPDGRPPGMPQQQQQVMPAVGVQQGAPSVGGAGTAAGMLARKLAEPVMSRVASAAPVVVGSLAFGAVALGAIWLSRQIEQGSPKKGEPKHLRLDMATIAPVIAAIVIGAILLYVFRKFREMNDTIKLADMLGPGQQAPLFQAQGPGVPGMAAQSPEQEMAQAQALLNGAF